ncbi:aromatic ring-hydroxylating oxygenase subunit alpha [Mycolicibacterium stellerae]|uniref:aromatic ring-hydroxylating oxygenase subunit alpha n=1 Tax=Mycolicibacterium stellerae TaxID=2358193 RepID=UPI0019D0AA72|nr:aromatic ring-hydroxylating dioxygenase subunit alpha [Mycolicibacterium stellerae]
MSNPTRRPLQPALDRHHYVDAASFDREAGMLRREWTCIGRLDEFGLAAAGHASPNRRAVVCYLGESVIVTADAAGALHAFANVCRHRGSQVVPVEPGIPAEPCSAKSLRCPYHSWTYGLDGRLLHAPHTDDIDLDTSRFGLQTLHAAAWGGFLWLTEDLEAPAVVDALHPVPERVRRYPLDTLVVGMRLTYSVAANWKVIAENYNECYHCGPVHPELSRLVPAFGDGGGADLAWDDGIPHRDGAWTFTVSGTTDRAPFPDLDEAERVRHKGELVYPNLLLSLSAEHVAAFVLRPTAVDRTEITCDLLFAPDESAKPEFDPSDAGDLWDLVNRQDWAICESVQRGMTSRYYTQGWFAPMEDASADIRRWLLPRLERHG